MKGSTWPRPSETLKDPKTGKKVRRPVKGSTWTYGFSVPKPDGGSRQIAKGGYPTKRAAEEALAHALSDHGRSPGPKAEPSKMALSSYLTDEWLPTCGTLKPATRNSYRFVIDTYIAPNLGDVRLCDVTQAHLVKLYGKLRSNGGTKRKKSDETNGPIPLAESTVHKTHVVLGAALGHAVEVGMLRVNPVLQVPKKNRPTQKSHTRAEMRVWTATQAQTFLAAIAADRLAAVYELDLNTGLRRGELAGLRWEDVDLDGSVIRVRRNRVSVDHEVHDGVPKSGRARTVDLDEDTVAMLRSHRRRQLEERLKWGEAWTDNGLVFTREDGTALHPGTITWHLSRLIKIAKVPVIRLHDLRHTHATLGLAAGVPVKVMSERLGHATTSITQDLYQHVIPGMGSDAAAKIGALLRQAT